MLQVNYYKKTFYLTDSETKKIQEFFEAMFQVKDIATINIYCDQGVVCEIVGNDNPFTKTIGSCIKHDIENGEQEQ